MMVSKRGVLYYSVVLSLLCIVIVLFIPESNGETLVVANYEPVDFTSINDALNGSSDGDTILLMPGHYYAEDITINISVKIQGSGKDRTFITSRNGIHIIADNVEMSNLSVIRSLDCSGIGYYLCWNYYGRGMTIQSNGTLLHNMAIEVNGIALQLVDSRDGHFADMNLRSYSYSRTPMRNAFEIENSSHNEFDHIQFPDRQGIRLILSDWNHVFKFSCGSIQLIESHNNIISDNTIDGWGSYVMNFIAQLDLESSHGNEISSNIVLNFSRGISLSDSDRNSIFGNVLYHERMSDKGIGLSSITSHWNNFTNNQITNCSHAIQLDSSHGWNITGNRMVLINETAVSITSSNSTLLHSNTIIYARQGMFIYHSPECSIKENLIFIPEYTGVGIHNSSSVWRKEVFPDNERSIFDLDQSGIILKFSDGALINGNFVEEYCIGLRLISSRNAAIVQNNFWDNHFGVALEGDCSNVTVKGNTFWGNSKGINLFEFPLPMLNATENYWGHDSGPYHPLWNPEGRVDSFTDNIAFEPWLDSNGNLTFLAKPMADDPTEPIFPLSPVLSILILYLIVFFGFLIVIVSLSGDQAIVASSSHQLVDSHPSHWESPSGESEYTISPSDLTICQFCGNIFTMDEGQPSIRQLCPHCGEDTVTKNFQ